MPFCKFSLISDMEKSSVANSNNRIIGLDKLRFLMVIFVIVNHGAHPFMKDGSAWWYFLDKHSSFFYSVIVVAIDSFFMNTMFFLSGFFVVSSFKNRNLWLYFRSKFMHIGMAWILGYLLMAPILNYVALKPDVRATVTVIDFLSTYFSSAPVGQQGYFWFLSLLFVFLVAFGFLAYYIPAITARRKSKISPYIPIIIVIFITAVSYYLSSVFYIPAAKWIHIEPIFAFQPSKVISYIACFALGVYAKSHGWLRDGGWIPSQKVFFSLMALSVLFLIYNYLIYLKTGITSYFQVIDAVSYALYSIFVTFAFISFFYKRTSEDWLSKNATYSYGVYWSHVFLFIVQILILDLDIPIFIKFVGSISVTTFLCIYFTRYVLKKLPLFRDIF